MCVQAQGEPWAAIWEQDLELRWLSWLPCGNHASRLQNVFLSSAAPRWSSNDIVWLRPSASLCVDTYKHHSTEKIILSVPYLFELSRSPRCSQMSTTTRSVAPTTWGIYTCLDVQLEFHLPIKYGLWSIDLVRVLLCLKQSLFRNSCKATFQRM